MSGQVDNDGSDLMDICWICMVESFVIQLWE